MAVWLTAGRVQPAFAQEGARVLAVEVQGTRSVASETALAQVQTRSGMSYMDNVVSEDIRRLYALGYFTDVRVETQPLQDGIKVIFVVKEKPTIASVEIVGAKRLRKERVRDLLGLKKGELYDPRKVKEGLDRVKAEYRRKGYFQAGIETSASVNDAANAATVYAAIDEGPRMRIKRILIEGNLAFSDRKIRQVMKTKRKGWFSSGIYDEQVLEEDLERIRGFYRKHGYQDVDLTKEVVTDPSGKWLFIHLTVTEGLQHRVGQVTLTGAQLFPEVELRQLLSLKPGAVFTTEALQEDLRAIKQHYGDRGYINAQVAPETQLDDATKRVNLTLRITENELTHVDRIDIRGNLRTKDVVVRRELRIYPGETFDGKKIRRSVERLYNLGFFEEVNVETEPTAQPNREDLVVQVKEAKTGSFSFGGGFSSVDRVVGLVELEQRNFDWRNPPQFVGAGQDLRFRIEIGTVRRFFDLSFTEPWLLGHPVSFGVDAFNRTRLRSRNLGLAYEEERRGGGIRLGKELTETLRADTSYQLFRTVISDVAGDASADLKAEEGRNDISVADVTLTWDRRDNRFDPTKGAYVYASADLAGGVLSGDKDFYRIQAGASAYLPHVRRLVFESRASGGIVNEYSNTAEVPIFERFFAGGANTIRGFRERSVGPHDPLSNDPIGGEAILIGTVEEVATLFQDERGKPILKGSAFYDVGNVWRRVGDFASSVEMGTGVGVRVNTPIGPLRLDLGFPITRIGAEKRRPRVHFNISRSF
ncbi:MAG: outer membrane protein assembly factor BamA [Candidatus Omnitrophica bacterium]|nr:outer membrane protein assembly factor BamA [Candidatus Omnitrophota bacterium]